MTDPRLQPWQPEEDAALVAVVKQLGTESWSRIAKQLGTVRTGKSCRLRWGTRPRILLSDHRFGASLSTSRLSLCTDR